MQIVLNCLFIYELICKNKYIQTTHSSDKHNVANEHLFGELKKPKKRRRENFSVSPPPPLYTRSTWIAQL